LTIRVPTIGLPLIAFLGALVSISPGWKIGRC
jgi:hypothetical protein